MLFCGHKMVTEARERSGRVEGVCAAHGHGGDAAALWQGGLRVPGPLYRKRMVWCLTYFC